MPSLRAANINHCGLDVILAMFVDAIYTVLYVQEPSQAQ